MGFGVESDRAHKAFAEQLALDFPLVSDFNRDVVPQFGIQYRPEEAYTGFHGMAKRSVFVIDRDGTVRYRWVSEDPTVAPEMEPVLETLRSLSRGLASLPGSTISRGHIPRRPAAVRHALTLGRVCKLRLHSEYAPT